MKFTIITDSSCDIKHTNITSDKFDFITIPMNITLDEHNFSDEENLDTNELLKRVKKSKLIKTSCPSPQRFMQEMQDKDNIICITLSSKLSGTFNSVRLAAEQILTDNPDKNIFILDSKTTSAGLALILNKLMQIIQTEDYVDFKDVTYKISAFTKSSKIRFILQDFGVMIKTGRVGKIAGLIASVLALKTICGDNGDGEIKMYKKILGNKKAVTALANYPAEEINKKDIKTAPIVISHCNNEEDAIFIEKFLKAIGFDNIKTYIMRGIACLYASDKGIAIAY